MKRTPAIFVGIVFFVLVGLLQPAVALEVSGKVFEDANGNGRFDSGEKPLSAVVVSDGVAVVATGKDGLYTLQTEQDAIVFVSVPGAHRAPENRFYRKIENAANIPAVDFPLVRNRGNVKDKKFRLVFASDTHVGFIRRAREGTAKAFATIMAQRPDLVLHGGDIILDGLKVTDQGLVEKQYQLYVNELFPLIKAPFYHTIGNHDVFGWVALPDPDPAPPLYGKEAYRKYFGPLYYSFNYEHCHFVVLDSIALGRPLNKEISYYGFIDETQLEWLRQDLQHIDPATPVILVTHIPTINALSSLFGLKSEIAATPAGDVILKHQVSNFPQLFGVALKGYNFKLALAGHYHTFEEIHWQTSAHNAFFVVGGSVSGEWWKGDHTVGYVSWPEGFTLIDVDGEDFDISYVPYGWKGEEE